MKHIIRIKSFENDLVGIANECGEIILPPTFNHINGFNKDG